MPLYEYECTNKERHRVEAQRKIDERDQPLYCERCRIIYSETIPMQRVPVLVSPSFPGAANWRG